MGRNPSAPLLDLPGGAHPDQVGVEIGATAEGDQLILLRVRNRMGPLRPIFPPWLQASMTATFGLETGFEPATARPPAGGHDCQMRPYASRASLLFPDLAGMGARRKRSRSECGIELAPSGKVV